MTDLVHIVGFVATPPKHLVTKDGQLPITSFRFASTARRYDRQQQKWVDGETNWFTVTSFRQLAINAAGSVSKGDRLIVSGRLRIREWEAGEKSGTTVEIEAEAIGHDLSWGTTSFARSVTSSHAKETSEEFPPEIADPAPAEPELEAIPTPF
jgi:single-strand DNA-binding protein